MNDGGDGTWRPVCKDPNLREGDLYVKTRTYRSGAVDVLWRRKSDSRVLEYTDGTSHSVSILSRFRYFLYFPYVGAPLRLGLPRPSHLRSFLTPHRDPPTPQVPP